MLQSFMSNCCSAASSRKLSGRKVRLVHADMLRCRSAVS